MDGGGLPVTSGAPGFPRGEGRRCYPPVTGPAACDGPSGLWTRPADGAASRGEALAVTGGAPGTARGQWHKGDPPATGPTACDKAVLPATAPSGLWPRRVVDNNNDRGKSNASTRGSEKAPPVREEAAFMAASARGPTLVGSEGWASRMNETNKAARGLCAEARLTQQGLSGHALQGFYQKDGSSF